VGHSWADTALIADHPLQHKKVVIKALLRRAKFLTSNETNQFF